MASSLLFDPAVSLSRACCLRAASSGWVFASAQAATICRNALSLVSAARNEASAFASFVPIEPSANAAATGTVASCVFSATARIVGTAGSAAAPMRASDNRAWICNCECFVSLEQIDQARHGFARVGANLFDGRTSDQRGARPLEERVQERHCFLAVLDQRVDRINVPRRCRRFRALFPQQPTSFGDPV